jgi:hypothetical protein
MLRITAVAAFAAGMLAAPMASAQVVDLGRGGPRIDLRSPEQRYEDRAQRRMMMRDQDRAYGSRYEGRRGDGCRTVQVTRTDDYGRRVTRTRRDCD